MSAGAFTVQRFSADPYPGDIPGYSYCMDSRSDVILRICAESDGPQVEGKPLRDYLSQTEAPEESYIPILSYGSNACPARLQEKFATFADYSRRPVRVAAIWVTVTGVGRAWARQTTRGKGVVPYTLISNHEIVMQAHVLLFPEVLIATIDSSEGRGIGIYPAVRLTEASVLIGGGIWKRPLTYLGVGSRGPFSFNGVLATPANLGGDEAKHLIKSGAIEPNDKAIPPHEAIDKSVSLIRMIEPEGIDRPVFRFLESE